MVSKYRAINGEQGKKNKEGKLILCDYLCPSKLTQGQILPYCVIVIVLLGTTLVSAPWVQALPWHIREGTRAVICSQ